MEFIFIGISFLRLCFFIGLTSGKCCAIFDS